MFPTEKSHRLHSTPKLKNNGGYMEKEAGSPKGVGGETFGSCRKLFKYTEFDQTIGAVI